MNIVVFDTETTGLDKPFCYNIGYVIVDSESWTIVQAREYIVEQVWHNPMLFSTAYYAEKRPIYVKAMRARSIVMDKFGYICQQMIRDFKAYDVACAYAYNSSFDERVFSFNCDWFKCNNPFDTVPIYDIRGNAHQFIVNNQFKKWCEEAGEFTESGNYSTTAETMYRYLMNDTQFIESHTALSDSLIEKEILQYSVIKGAKLNESYQAFRSIPRKVIKTLDVFQNGEKVFTTDYETIRVNKEKTKITLK